MPLLFCTLLVLPATAIYQVADANSWKWIAFYVFAISTLTYGLYWHDKRQAQSNRWRVPESQLHLVELLGGWPIAFLAQQQLRHKTQKRSFQLTYWGIVLLHQYISIELAFKWPFGGSLFYTN